MAESGGLGDGRGLDDLFWQAMDLAPAQRPSFLATACGGDTALRAELESLLGIAEANPDLMVPPDIGLIPERLGRYEVLGERGRGAMGIVFEARDSHLLRTVALKVLPQHLSRESRSLDRFTREARTLARLNHPNIATLYSLEQSDGFHYLTMEFVEGVTLAEVLADRRLSVRETLSLAVQIALALEAAHALGICHCDLKPSNIMLDAAGKVSLLDFGIARAFEHLAPQAIAQDSAGLPATLPAGTPGYMAPEQLRAERVDERSDMWAFGVILYECLAGERYPWQGKEPPADWVGRLPRETPRDLIALIGDCLVSERGRRLDSAAEARDRLQKLRRRSPLWKRKLVAALAGLAAVAAAVVLLMPGQSPSGPLHRLQSTGDDAISGLNEQGEVLWSRRFDGGVHLGPVVRERSMTPGLDIPPMIVGCAVTVRLGGLEGVLEFLDAQSGATLWRHDPGWEVPVNALGPIYYRWTVSCPWPTERAEVMLSGIRNGLWYGFGVEALNVDGRVLGVYHHPGPLFVEPMSLAAESVQGGIILYGINSSARFNPRLNPFATENHIGCLVKLTPGDIAGQAYPYSEDQPAARDWPGLPRAREAAYLLIPLISPQQDSYVEQLLVHDRRSGRSGYTAITSDGRSVIVDDDLLPLKSVIIRGGPADSLLQAGVRVDPPFLYMRAGEMQWVEVPVEY